MPCGKAASASEPLLGPSAWAAFLALLLRTGPHTARHEEERPQKAGAGAGEVVTRWADRHVQPGIGGTKAYNFYDFFVAALEVIYHATCGVAEPSW